MYQHIVLIKRVRRIQHVISLYSGCQGRYLDGQVDPVDGFGVARLTNARDGVIFRMTGEKYFERTRPNVKAADEVEG